MTAMFGMSSAGAAVPGICRVSAYHLASTRSLLSAMQTVEVIWVVDISPEPGLKTSVVANSHVFAFEAGVTPGVRLAVQRSAIVL